MLRYDRQTKPGLVALYNIRPGNGARPFLQPRSPHGAHHPYIQHAKPTLIYLLDNQTDWFQYSLQSVSCFLFIFSNHMSTKAYSFEFQFYLTLPRAA